jgi:hypothetical protein
MTSSANCDAFSYFLVGLLVPALALIGDLIGAFLKTKVPGAFFDLLACVLFSLVSIFSFFFIIAFLLVTDALPFSFLVSTYFSYLFAFRVIFEFLELYFLTILILN